MLTAPSLAFQHKHLLGIEGLQPFEIQDLLERADGFVALNRQSNKKLQLLRGLTHINLFFESSTRTQTSFELAGKRLGADVVNMSVKSSSVAKGETLIDTAATLNAMRPDLLVIRHGSSGAVKLLSRKVDCAVINAGDGTHEHPTQALLDALTIRRRKGNFQGLKVAICGDVLHSRVARSNAHLLTKLGAHVVLAGPRTLMPFGLEKLIAPGNASIRFADSIEEAISGADVVMMLRIQMERQSGGFFPSLREYSIHFGLNKRRLALAKPDAIVLHPGPINRGVEIDSDVADGASSLILDQVENGVAVRMAILYLLAGGE